MATVIQPDFSGRMTEAEFRLERAEIERLYGRSSIEAGARREQALARLFHRTGWTQEQLAKAEGKSLNWMSQRLRFGRFLDFYTTGVNSQNPAFSRLTERRFRDFWSRALPGEGNERIRFREVVRLIEEETTQQLRLKARPLIGESIMKAFANDGKWHKASTIVGKIKDADNEQHVVDTLDRMRLRGNHNAKVETRKAGKTTEYRIFRQERTVSTTEIATELNPIIEQLRDQGKRPAGTMSGATVSVLAQRLANLLEKWA